MSLPYDPLVDKEKRDSKTIEARITQAHGALLHWHQTHGRHDLPWRLTHDLPERKESHPYAVLVSEFMLQQTTVSTVEPRFAMWMQLFPTIATLAGATEAAVLAAWQGLGYYSRARRLHAAARFLMERHEGKVPETREELLSLPGIGEYTAAAILAFAYDKPAVVLDTNITRVIARWSNLHLPIDSAKGKQALETAARTFFLRSLEKISCSELAQEFWPLARHDEGAYPLRYATAEQRSQWPKKTSQNVQHIFSRLLSPGSRAITTALMDLGATICVARTPRCAVCPLQATCQASTPEILPRKSPRAVTTKRREHRAWFLQNGRLFLELSEGPLWRGLWILPLLGTNQPAGKPVAEITYPITRYRVTMKLFPVKGTPPASLKGFTPQELEQIALPSPHRRAIEKGQNGGKEKTGS